MKCETLVLKCLNVKFLMNIWYIIFQGRCSIIKVEFGHHDLRPAGWTSTLPWRGFQTVEAGQGGTADLKMVKFSLKDLKVILSFIV